MKKNLSFIFVLLLMFSLVACTERKVPEEEVVKEPETQEETETETETETPEPTDGALVGEAEGFSNTTPIKVEVVMDGDTITSVTILENDETPEVAGTALETVPQAIVDANSPDVDVVAGATWTSNGIMNAVKNAIGGGSTEETTGEAPAGALTGEAEGFSNTTPIKVEVVMDGDTITSVTVVENEETPEVAGTALETVPQAIVDANSPDVDVVAGATWTSNGIMNAVKNAIGGGSTEETTGEAPAGALTGEAEGFSNTTPIKVEVVMDGDTITSVTVLENDETPEVAGTALETVPQAIVDANSPDVDVVAGATWTSNGIMNAVKNAIGQ